jgi:hypothetical protein
MQTQHLRNNKQNYRTLHPVGGLINNISRPYLPRSAQEAQLRAHPQLMCARHTRSCQETNQLHNAESSEMPANALE